MRLLTLAKFWLHLENRLKGNGESERRNWRRGLFWRQMRNAMD
jgi:hypothetical protein